jgi:methyl-accepting chemotaxis protein
VLALVLGGAAITLVTEHRQSAALTDVRTAAETVAGSSMALARAAKNIELDVIQVQQFLQDVSATRALDGLDDGFKDAQRFADKFAADVAAATGLAETLRLTDVIRLLAETKDAFRPYYETGRRMAQAYVDKGPAGGNQMMPAFDETSDQMQAKVEQLLTLADAAVGKTTAQLRDTIDRIQEGGERLAFATVLIGALGTLAAIGLGVLAFTGIVRPLSAMTGSMRLLAGGNIAIDVPGQGRGDEIGAMAAAVLVFRDHMIKAERLAASQAEERQQAEAEKRAALTRMANTIESETGTALEQMRQRTAAMRATADEMSASAGRTGVSAENAAAAAAQTLANAQTVASAAEELSASIHEISRQVSQSSTIVSSAVAAGSETRGVIEVLNQQVEQIGAVADMIGEIAAKTNLLALNATIEAARAGDAGKGFAVVASEVKQLATQTARSTQEIAAHIAQVRSATSAAAAAVGQIEQTIGKINAISGSIAAAVEQQGAATAEIARNVAESAGAADEMTARTTEVSTEAGETGRRAAEVSESSTGLNDAMDDLRRSVIRVVRTSTAEVDRRRERRYSNDLVCHLLIAGHSSPAHVADLSDHGAFVRDAPSVPIGTRGTLKINGVDFALPFHVRAVEDSGLRLEFELDEATAAKFQSVPERLAIPSAA